MKNFTFLTLLLIGLGTAPVFSQAVKNIFVEHYSNTKCPNCQRSRSGVYDDLADYKGEVNHMTIHYQYPYSTCPLYQYNKKEADNRAEVYAGSTDPISGAPILCVNSVPGSSRLFGSKLEQAMKDKDVFVGLNMVEKGTSSKDVTLEVTNLTEGEMDDLYVYAALVEKEVNIKVDGQDWEIHDVFRKFLGSEEGKGNALGSLKPGEKEEINLKGDVPQGLEPSDMFVLAWVEQRVPEGNKYRLIMHNSVSVQTSTITRAELELTSTELSIYPNPAQDVLYIQNRSDFLPRQFRIMNTSGQELKRMTAQENIRLTDLVPGNYYLIMESEEYRVTRKFVKY